MEACMATHLTAFAAPTGARGSVYGYTPDLESGKAKFLAAKNSEHERDYVARYGQKAYKMGSGNQMASMPEPLTPGHTSTLKIKALPEQDMPSPGKSSHLQCCNYCFVVTLTVSTVEVSMTLYSRLCQVITSLS